jgi:hypothetical protein
MTVIFFLFLTWERCRAGRPGCDDAQRRPEVLTRVLEDIEGDDLAAEQRRQRPARDDAQPPVHQVAGRRLGGQRLVAHVRARVGDHHRRLARAQQPFQARRGVHAAVPAAGDQDPWLAVQHFLQPSLVKIRLLRKYFAAEASAQAHPATGHS